MQGTDKYFFRGKVGSQLPKKIPVRQELLIKKTIMQRKPKTKKSQASAFYYPGPCV